MKPISLDQIYQPLDCGETLFYGINRLHNLINDYPLNINPDFQRSHVWDINHEMNFVGYLLEGGLVLPGIINVGKNGILTPAELVDGKQRLLACIDWVDGRIDALLSDGRRVSYKNLDNSSKRACSMTIGLKFVTPRLTRKESLELYIKVNRGGVVHTDTEIAYVKHLLKMENQ